MIAVDSSSFIAYLEGSSGHDVDSVDEALMHGQLVLPPVVLSELLSDPGLSSQNAGLLLDLPQLTVQDGYWERVGRLRAKLLGRRLKARLVDCLIAQSCLDYDTPLVTRDGDFRHFVRHDGLELCR